MPTVDIEAESERGDGPVRGYVAHRSLTGSKTDTPISQTPQSIAVVPKNQLRDQHVMSVAEALRYTPGVMTDYRGASNLRDELFVRGFYYAPRYLDGLYLSGDLSYARMQPYLLERVELLSGPASVLYGQANPGGLVNMVSKKPTGVPVREVGLTLGTNRQREAFFDFADKVPGSDVLSYRVTGIGQARNLQEDHARQRAFAIAPSFAWTPTDRTSLTVLSGYEYEPDAGFRNFLDAAGTLTPIAGYGYVPRDFFVSDPGFEKFQRRQAWIGYEFAHDVNDSVTLRQNARYHHMDMTHHTLVWGRTAADPVTGVHNQVIRMPRGGDERWNQFGIDNQAEVKLETGAVSHTLLAGLDYRHRTRNYVWGGFGSAPAISLTNPVYGAHNFAGAPFSAFDDQRLVARQTGLYAQDQAKIGNLHLSLGLRHDWATTRIDDRLTGARQSYRDSAFTWRAGALYRFDNGLAPYASYSTSFEPSLYAAPAGQGAFSPSKARQVEIGIKYEPEGSNTLLTAALYDLSQRDIVMGEWNSATSRTVYRQIGQIRSRGVELSARADVTDQLQAIASYSYIDSTVKKTVVASELGKTPSRVPTHQAALWSVYTVDSAPLSGRLDGLALGLGLRYVGKSQGNAANTFTVPSVTLADAMISYDFGALDQNLKGLSLQLNGKNLTDKRYVASCASAFACFYGEGRVVTATLRKSW